MKIFRNQRGQALVEFAIILPLLLLVMMAIAQLGFVFNTYLSIQNASREGARGGAVGRSNSEITSLVLATSPMLQQERLVVNITPSEGNRISGQPLTVEITYSYKLTVPVISTLFSNEITLRARTSMRIE